MMCAVSFGERRNWRIRAWLLFVPWLVTWGCSPDPLSSGADVRGPELVQLEQLVLQDSDTLYLAQPSRFAVAPGGRIAVIDGFPRHVVLYTPDGSPTRVVSRVGQGPGELLGPSTLDWANDSTLVVGDFMLRRLNIFDIPSNRFRGPIPLEGYPSTILVDDGSQGWLGNYSLDHHTGVSVVDLDKGTIRHLVSIPYRSGSVMEAREISMGVLKKGDSLLVTFSAWPGMFLTDLRGTVLDTIEVPAVRRRGLPDNYETIVETKDQVRSFSVMSLLVWNSLRGDGSAVLVYYDQDFVDRAFRAKIYLTVLSKDLSSACLDTEVPAGGEVRAEVYARGDTLYVLDQTSGEGERLVTTITTYLIETDNCEWVPTTRARWTN